MIGPGKYDALCTEVREKTKAAGGVILMVFGGERGDGFSVQTTVDVLVTLPRLLREVARQIEKDMNAN